MGRRPILLARLAYIEMSEIVRSIPHPEFKFVPTVNTKCTNYNLNARSNNPFDALFLPISASTRRSDSFAPPFFRAADSPQSFPRSMSPHRWRRPSHRTILLWHRPGTLTLIQRPTGHGHGLGIRILMALPWDSDDSSKASCTCTKGICVEQR